MRTARHAMLAVLILLSGRTLLAGEKALQCANLIYAGTRTSRCFSDEFLSTVQQETAVATERRFKAVKLGSDELFSFPFVVMTGEDDFVLAAQERENLRKYLTNGGFLLASAGCSSDTWSKAFRREIKAVFADQELAQLPLTHALFRSFYEIKELVTNHEATDVALWGLEIDGRAVLVFSPHGLNDTAHSEGCCCCGGNEIKNSLQVNVNVFVYALLH